MSDFDIGGMDFDQLARLAQEDPEAFEALRQREVKALIESAPESSRKRLQGLQWQIDMERSQADTPLAACVRISRMMWDSVVGAGGLLERINDLHSGNPPPQPEVRAEVLPFRSGTQDPQNGPDG